MRVLVGCEESQAITKAFRARGHEAYSCDLKDCSGGHPEWHIKGDFLVVVNHPETHISVEREGIGWDIVICHPPCTHIANSGARHFEKKRKDGSQKEAIEFFCKCINLDVPRLCVENPVNIISGDYIKKYYPDLCEKYGLPVKPTQGNSQTKSSTVIIYKDGKYSKLSPIDCERLQCLPDNYTDNIPMSKRFKVIGNGWTVDVIKYLFSFLKEVK